MWIGGSAKFDGVATPPSQWAPQVPVGGNISTETALDLYRSQIATRPSLVLGIQSLFTKIVVCTCTADTAHCHGNVLVMLAHAFHDVVAGPRESLRTGDSVVKRLPNELEIGGDANAAADLPQAAGDTATDLALLR